MNVKRVTIKNVECDEENTEGLRLLLTRGGATPSDLWVFDGHGNNCGVQPRPIPPFSIFVFLHDTPCKTILRYRLKGYSAEAIRKLHNDYPGAQCAIVCADIRSARRAVRTVFDV